jgi:translation elongation factor EF-Tu-like GTPase
MVDDEELLELVELEIRQLAEECGLSVSSLVRS